MAEGHEFRFGGFRLDVRSGQLWRGAVAVRLRPKSWAVLHYLVAHPGQLVTKDELLQAVWPDTVVSEAALAVCLNELRQALGETAQAPRYIATVHRRGYRFVAPVTRGSPPEALALPVPAGLAPASPPFLVGREAELQRLHTWCTQAQGGTRQAVFIAGEAGMGKTTLVDAFVARLAAEAPCWLARGQCIAHYGAGEAYLPVLDALGRLCRTPGSERFLAGLEQWAPTWVVQMPTLLDTGALEAV